MKRAPPVGLLGEVLHLFLGAARALDALVLLAQALFQVAEKKLALTMPVGLRGLLPVEVLGGGARDLPAHVDVEFLARDETVLVYVGCAAQGLEHEIGKQSMALVVIERLLVGRARHQRDTNDVLGGI